jgi:glycosyltransferase involved in cell wall biosynthesis
MPVYNAERYLPAALDSIFAQSWTDFEVIAVDDGSTDGSSSILAAFSARHEKLRVRRQANSGISAALNNGLAEARGEFIARMDADDIMLPDRLARQVSFLRAHPVLGFCSCYMNLIDGHGETFSVYRPKPNHVDELAAMIAAEQPITYTHPTVMARRLLMLAAGGYDSRFEPCEDIDLFARLIVAGHPGVIIPDILFSYRLHGESISGRAAGRQAEMLHLVMRNLQARLEGRMVASPATLGSYRDALPPIRRLAYDARLRSEAWRQMANYDRAAHRRWKAHARLAAAAAVEPHLLPRRVLNRILASLRPEPQ